MDERWLYLGDKHRFRSAVNVDMPDRCSGAKKCAVRDLLPNRDEAALFVAEVVTRYAE
jgi:hypothetical protein